MADHEPAAVLFDVDGTLMDTVPLHTVAWWEALRQSGERVAMVRVHRAIGMGGDHLLDALLGEDRDHDGDAALKAAHDALYGQYWSRLTPLHRAADLLRACADRGLRVVLASSASGPEADVMRLALDADDAIHAMTSADDVESSKPAPDLVHRALDKAGVPPERAVFVGDAVWDVEAARKAGVPCVAVLTGGGFSRQELLDAGAREVHESPADLLDHLADSAVGGLRDAPARPRPRTRGPLMTTYGYFLSCEEFTPAQLIEQARMAEEAGFGALAISDHFHPWNDEQGSSPFVWSMIGALSQVTSLPVTTFVTCPTVRVHPALTAQAAATSGVLTGGRFRFGVGSGEALNEHILGDDWPEAGDRLEMLEEAVEVIRKLFGGEQISHRGPRYTVRNARLYTLPDEPVPIYISAFGPRAAAVAGRIGDGLITMSPDTALIEDFRKAGGEGKPVLGGFKVCWGADRDRAVRTAHRLWPNERLPGELAQLLPTPRHFEQASTLVTEEMVADGIVCGDAVDEHVEAVDGYLRAGFDEIYVNQIGQEQRGFFDFYRDEVLPRVTGR